MSILPGSCDTITIDEEFRAHCPPLTETERQMLRQDIERTGLLSPLIVWNHEGKTILVDGHTIARQRLLERSQDQSAGSDFLGGERKMEPIS